MGRPRPLLHPRARRRASYPRSRREPCTVCRPRAHPGATREQSQRLPRSHLRATREHTLEPPESTISSHPLPYFHHIESILPF
jgi:hypothetical protein